MILVMQRIVRKMGVLLGVGFFVLGCMPALAQSRFPAPEFETEYVFPGTTQPPPSSVFNEYVDVGILTVFLLLACYFVFKKRSRRGLFVLTVLSLVYFGFIREGCVCPIGSIQNVTLSFFDTQYALALTTLLFFLIPLGFALFAGRVFCSGICPLGAIQDLVVIHPLRLPRAVNEGLSMFKYIYLGLAVLLAATGTGFIICKFDPFVGFFRMHGNPGMIFLGAGFLLVGTVIARPYCRFICPYSVLLNWMSRFSKWHLSITPDYCIQCRLCEEACPFDYIHQPNVEQKPENRNQGLKRLNGLVLLLPVLVVLFGWVGGVLSEPLAQLNRTVSLAEQLLDEPEGLSEPSTDAIEAFSQSGQSFDDLMLKAKTLRRQFHVGGWLLGIFLGLVFGFKLIKLSLSWKRHDYEVDRGNCLSCGRCFSSCPNDKENLFTSQGV